jgi:hypothetical protein
MYKNKQKLNCQHANQIDLVEYLASLGYKPRKTKNDDYWYLSPFRDEETPSFKINRRKNVWYDHGEGIGGSLVDFGLRYFKCQIPELLDRIICDFILHLPPTDIPWKTEKKPDNSIKIIDIGPINSFDLLLYIKDRRIDFSIATRYCKQVVFEIQNKPIKAIGFPNDLGGYELRNLFFKGSSSPKAVSSFGQEGKELAVFEGFFDFLSYQMMNREQEPNHSDFLILNSTAFFEKSRSMMENYPSIKLYLDHDFTGEKCTRQALEWGVKFEDASKLYTGHKDLNEWIQSVGKAEKKSHQQRIK